MSLPVAIAWVKYPISFVTAARRFVSLVRGWAGLPSLIRLIASAMASVRMSGSSSCAYS